MAAWFAILACCVVLASAQNPSIRFVNALNNATWRGPSLVTLAVNGTIRRPMATRSEDIVLNLSPKTVSPVYNIVEKGSRVTFSFWLNYTEGKYHNTTEAFNATEVLLDTDAFYTVIVYGTNDMRVTWFKDDLTKVHIGSVRINIVNVAGSSSQSSTDVNFNLTGTHNVTGVSQNWFLGNINSPMMRLNISSNHTISTLSWTSAAFGTRTATYSTFYGAVYTFWLFGDLNPLAATPDQAAIVLTKDSDVGLWIPPALVPNPQRLGFSADRCQNIVCDTGRVCRNGRCLRLDQAGVPFCRDYLGFDLAEVARFHLIEVWSEMQTEAKDIVNQLKSLKKAIANYDPNSGRLNLTDYLFALQSFCQGRDRQRCPASQCEAGVVGANNSTCSAAECAIPLSCVGLAEIEFLQMTFLSATARLAESNGRTLPSCLQPFSSKGLEAALGSGIRVPPLQNFIN